MQKIISKPTALFKSWLATYLTHDQTEQFLAHHINPLEILRIDQVKDIINHLRIHVETTRSRHKLSTKQGKRILNGINQERAIIKKCQQVIKRARLDDLIVHRLNDPHEQTAYHVMNNDDLVTLSDQLLHYLQRYLPIPAKITWILQHKTIANQTLTRKTGIPIQQITAIKSGKQPAEEVKLGHAMNIAKYYDDMVRKRLA